MDGKRCGEGNITVMYTCRLGEWNMKAFFSCCFQMIFLQTSEGRGIRFHIYIGYVLNHWLDAAHLLNNLSTTWDATKISDDNPVYDNQERASVPFTRLFVDYMGRTRSLDKLSMEWDRPIEWMVQRIYTSFLLLVKILLWAKFSCRNIVRWWVTGGPYTRARTIFEVGQMYMATRAWAMGSKFHIRAFFLFWRPLNCRYNGFAIACI